MKGINQKLKLYCPKWHSRIVRTKAKNIHGLGNWKNGLSIRSGPYCVVGELHGWTTDYTVNDNRDCDYCTSLAVSLMNHAYSEETIIEFYSDIEELVGHVEKDHPEIVERCRTQVDRGVKDKGQGV